MARSLSLTRSLPKEILFVCLSFLEEEDRPALLQCSVASRGLCILSRPLVFKRVSMDYACATRFLAFLFTDHRVALAVKSVTFISPVYERVPHSTTTPFIDLLNTLPDVRQICLRGEDDVFYCDNPIALCSSISLYCERPSFQSVDVWVCGEMIWPYSSLSKLRKLRIQDPVRAKASHFLKRNKSVSPPKLLPLEELQVTNATHPRSKLSGRWLNLSCVKKLSFQSSCYHDKDDAEPAWVVDYLQPSIDTLETLTYFPTSFLVSRPDRCSLSLSELGKLRTLSLHFAQKYPPITATAAVTYTNHVLARSTRNKPLALLVLHLNYYKTTSASNAARLASFVDRNLLADVTYSVEHVRMILYHCENDNAPQLAYLKPSDFPKIEHRSSISVFHRPVYNFPPF